MLLLLSEHSKNMQWNLRRFEKIPSCNFRVAILKEHTGNVQSVTFSNAGLMVCYNKGFFELT